MSGCVFCEIIAGRAPVDLVVATEHSWIIRPLGPVVDGHVLVIPTAHVADLAEDADGVSAQTMADAAAYARDFTDGSFNIITSAGRAATQSVFHLHVHVVPRAEDDLLMLPWGTVYGDDPQAPHWCRVAQGLQEQLDAARTPAPAAAGGELAAWLDEQAKVADQRADSMTAAGDDYCRKTFARVMARRDTLREVRDRLTATPPATTEGEVDRYWPLIAALVERRDDGGSA